MKHIVLNRVDTDNYFELVGTGFWFCNSLLCPKLYRLLFVKNGRAKNQFMNVNPGICLSHIFSCKPSNKIMVSGPYEEFNIKSPTGK